MVLYWEREIRREWPEYDIKIDSINARGLVPSIKFNVQEEGQKEEALKKVGEGYEKTIERIWEWKVTTLNQDLTVPPLAVEFF